MSTARRKYVGCIATRTPLEVYKECLDEYNDSTAKYEQYGIVPYNTVRERQYNTELSLGNNNRATTLKLSEKAKISYLLRSIREYINKNPNYFNNYLNEIKAKSKYLKAIK